MATLVSEVWAGIPVQNAEENETSQESEKRGLKRKLSDTQSSLLMCQVCQISLNSASQAIQHFQGRSHLGKVRNSYGDNFTVPKIPTVTAQGVPSFVPTSTDSDSSPVLQKLEAPVLSMPISTERLCNLYCSVCGKSFNSQSQAQQHYVGRQHQLKAQQKDEMVPLETLPQATVVAAPSLSQGTVPSGGVTSASNVKLGSNVKAKLFRCEACSITLNSEAQFQQHNRGLRHKMTTGQVTVPPPPEDEGWQGVRYKKLAKVVNTVDTPTGTVMVPSSTPGGTRLGQFYCEVCDISVNSQIQLQQHLSGEKHKIRVTGEPGQRMAVPPQGRGRQQGRGFPHGQSRGGFRGRHAVPPGRGKPALYSYPRPPPLYNSFVSGGDTLPDY